MLNENLKKLRIENGLTQQKLASIFCTTRQNISHLESGYIEPNVDTIRKYCLYFDITADELLDLSTTQQKTSLIKKYNFTKNN